MLKLLNWFKKNLAFILAGIFLFCLIACFVSGCNYHKNRFKCPEITTHTVIIHDTLIHNIVDSFPYYISNTVKIIYRDTIIQPVDTAEILRDYFALHVYNRQWEDSLLSVNLRDTITENHFLGNKFQYQILRPQTITYNNVDNSVTYNSYLYCGIGTQTNNINNIELNGLLAFPKIYIGAGYLPNIKAFNAKIGIKLLSFKAKK